MKIERVNLNSNKNQVGRKKKNNKNNLTTPNFGLPKVQKGNLAKDMVGFGAPVKNIRIYGENRHITKRHDLFKDFSKVFSKLSDSTKSLFKNIDTQNRSFMDAFDELDEDAQKNVPSLSITNIVNYSEDKIVSVKTLDDQNYTVIVRPNNESNTVGEVISEPSKIKYPYILKDLGVRIQKLSKNTYDLSEDFTILNTTSKILDPEDETDLVVTKEGAFVETEKADYLVQNIYDMKLPFIAHVDGITYTKQINDEILQVYKIRDEKELSNFMMNIMIHEIKPCTEKEEYKIQEIQNAMRIIKNIEQVATSRIDTGSNPKLFSSVFDLTNLMYNELQRKYIENFLNLKKQGNKVILDTTQWDEKKYLEFQDFKEKNLNTVFKNITDIKGNLTINKNKDIDFSSLEHIDGSLTISGNSSMNAPKLKTINENLILENGKANIPNLQQVKIVRVDINSKAKIPSNVEQNALYREFGVEGDTLNINSFETNKLLENRSSEQLNLLFKNIKKINNDFTLENHRDLKFPSLENINGSIVVKNAKNISFPKLTTIEDNLAIENSDYIDLSALTNVGSEYTEENSNKVFMKHTLKSRLMEMREGRKEQEFAQRRTRYVFSSQMSYEQQKLQLEKELEFEKFKAEREHLERMDKLKEQKAAMDNAHRERMDKLKQDKLKVKERHLERKDELNKDYLSIMDKHLLNIENLELKKLEFNERIEKAKLEIEDAHFKINKRLEELAITSEEKKQALLIEYQNKQIEQEMRNTEKWLELAYAKLEEEKDEHRDKMKLELYKLQNEYTLKVEEYKQIQNQQILQIEDAKQGRNFIQKTGDYVAKNGGFFRTFSHIASEAIDVVDNITHKFIGLFKKK